MDPHRKTEPAPLAVAALADLPQDLPVTLMALIRMRRDVADGAGDQAMRRWRRAIEPLMDEVGAEHVLTTRISHVVWGEADQWDYAFATRYPSPLALLRLLMDERMLEAVALRREAVEEAMSLVLVDSPGAEA